MSMEVLIVTGLSGAGKSQAVDCMEDMVNFGFKRSDACRYVGMFYQIRRAYFFISRELVGNSACMR